MKNIFILFLFIFNSNIFSQWFWQNPLPQGSPLSSVYFLNSNIGWSVGAFGVILKTTDGGINWVNQSGGTSDSLLSIYFIDSYIGWIGGANGIILKSSDGGVNWEKLNSGTIWRLSSIFFISSNVGWAVG